MAFVTKVDVDRKLEEGSSENDDWKHVSCLTPQKYCSGMVWIRDIAVLASWVASILLVVAAGYTMHETSYFKEAAEVSDGNFHAGRTAFTLMFVAFIGYASSALITLLLSLAASSSQNNHFKVIWPESSRFDIAYQVWYLITDTIVAVFLWHGVQRYADSGVGDTSCSGTDGKKACAFIRMVEHQLIYGYDLLIRKDTIDSSVPYDVIGRKLDVMFFNDVCIGLAVLFFVRFAVVLILYLAGYRPFYICCYNSKCLGTFGCAGVDGKETKDHIEAPCNLMGLLSPYVNDQLGALRNHEIVFSLLFAIAFVVLGSSLNNDQITGSYIPRKSVINDQSLGGSPTVPYCKWAIPYSDNKPKLTLFTSFASTKMTEADFTTTQGYLDGFNKTYATSSLPELHMNQLACINPDTKREDALPGAILTMDQESSAAVDTTYTCSQTVVCSVSPYTQCSSTTGTGTCQTSAGASPFITATTGSSVTESLTQADMLAKKQQGKLINAYDCCMGGDVYPDTEDSDIGSRFVAYSYLLLIGAVLGLFSQTALLLSITGYASKARALWLKSYDQSIRWWAC